MTTELIQSALKEVKYPGFSRDIISFGIVRSLDLHEGLAKISLEITTSDNTIPAKLKSEVEEKVNAVDGVNKTEVNVILKTPKTPPPAAGSGQVSGPSAQSIKGVKNIIAVASGKGGVGKSTVSVNLACALDQVLSAQGKPNSVGIMDCDIYGPSVPLMIGINSRPEVEGDQIKPIENFGIRVMSMGFLIDDSTPVVWRGPMIMKTIQQFAANVKWDELEVLVVDLPPGTGDAQLSLVQTLPLKGAVIVTTPQSVAVNVTQRGAKMFEKVNVPIMGVIENMSHLEAPDGSKSYIFGKDGGQQVANFLNTKVLGQIPLNEMIGKGSDQGIPTVISHSGEPIAQEFKKIAENLIQQLNTHT